jgi:hypothetical protein
LKIPIAKVRTKRKRPYRLAARTILGAAPPFTSELVRELLVKAQAGPKRGRRVKHPPPPDQAIKFLASVLNNRHALYFSAQESRLIKDRRDRAKALVDELRVIMPAIIKDAEQQLIKNDPFSHGVFAAASALHEVLSSDVPVRALPEVTLPENIRSWEWAAPSLYVDIKQIIGPTAGLRALVAMIPALTGETPAFATVKAYLLKQG